MDPAPLSTKSSVASAAFRAFAAWLAIYVIASQVLVITKWQSLAAVVQEEVVAADDGAAENVVVETAPTVPKSLQPRQKGKIRMIEKVIEDVKKAEARQQQLVADTDEKVQLLRERVMQPLLTGDRPSESVESPKLVFLENLLKRPTLSDLTDPSLLHLSSHAMKEVDAIAAANATVAWDQVATILTARYKRMDVNEVSRECPASPSSSIPDNIARESHLYQKIQQVEALMKQRAQNLPLLNDNDDSLLRVVQEHISELPERKEEKVVDGGPLCVSDQDIVDMVDQGFNALQRRLDLRRVLTKHVLSSWPDVNKTDLILDAFLDPPKSNAVAQKHTVNLRQVVDTPLLKETAKWVDVVVDQLSGYNDMVDQFLDNLAAEGPSVGQVLVSKVKTLAGKVELPNVVSKVPTKAGMLMR